MRKYYRKIFQKQIQRKIIKKKNMNYRDFTQKQTKKNTKQMEKFKKYKKEKNRKIVRIIKDFSSPGKSLWSPSSVLKKIPEAFIKFLERLLWDSGQRASIFEICCNTRVLLVQ